MFVCVLLTQGTPLKKVLTFTEEGTCQQSTLSVHHLQHLHHRKLLHLTQRDTTGKSCILVANVGSVFHLKSLYVAIGVFMQVSSSAQNVADVVKTAVHWHYTGEDIQERNRSNVLFVANDLQHRVTLLGTPEFTVDTNHTNVTCVTRHSVCLEV